MNSILTNDAIKFLTTLEREFGPKRKQLLEQRKIRQKEINQGIFPDFPNSHIRNTEWTVAKIPDDLQDRKVEITGPTERKTIINALNSGANCFMADFEDSNSPTWENILNGQKNLIDAVNRTIEYTNESGKHYTLNQKTAVLFVRPRGLHLVEKHFTVDGEPVSASLFDFGLYFFHNIHNLILAGTGPYFYLPKLQNAKEAEWWNDVFESAQHLVGYPSGTIRATVLIEHILAAFETEEILFALKDHSAGLNCGRWDYIFSFIKTFQNYPEFILPDRSQITMQAPFMEAYCKEVIRACHKHGIHAIGGMAAQIPIKNDPEANEKALEKVRLDKEREVGLFFSSTWVAHPGLIEIAKTAFQKIDKNQIDKQINEIITKEQLLEIPKGTVTKEGLKLNVIVGIRYLESWLSGNGCVPIYNLMEDFATCQIALCQIWQWIKHKHKVTKSILDSTIDLALIRIKSEIGEDQFKSGRFNEATNLFKQLCISDELVDFASIPAYELLEE